MQMWTFDSSLDVNPKKGREGTRREGRRRGHREEGRRRWNRRRGGERGKKPRKQKISPCHHQLKLRYDYI